MQTTNTGLVRRLRIVLRWNATSCLFCGAGMVLWHQQLAVLLGSAPPIVVLLVGLGLVVNGIHLVLASLRQTLRCYEITYFALGDFSWVLATIVLVTLRMGISTIAGAVLATTIATMVGTFGLLQAKYGRLAESEGLLTKEFP